MYLFFLCPSNLTWTFTHIISLFCSSKRFYLDMAAGGPAAVHKDDPLLHFMRVVLAKCPNREFQTGRLGLDDPDPDRLVFLSLHVLLLLWCFLRTSSWLARFACLPVIFISGEETWETYPISRAFIKFVSIIHTCLHHFSPRRFFPKHVSVTLISVKFISFKLIFIKFIVSKLISIKLLSGKPFSNKFLCIKGASIKLISVTLVSIKFMFKTSLFETFLYKACLYHTYRHQSTLIFTNISISHLSLWNVSLSHLSSDKLVYAKLVSIKLLTLECV